MRPSLFVRREIGRAETFSIVEAAEYLGCSFQTMKMALERGDIPYRQVGKKFWIRRDALDEWLSGTDGQKASLSLTSPSVHK